MTTFIASTDGGTITGSTSNDVIIGKSGDDILNGGAGADILLGGAGSDIIYYDEFDLKVDGGTGYDILIFGGTGQLLNLGLQKTVMNFEQIELAGGGGHSLTFSAADVLRTSDTDSLMIHGTQSSHVNFSDSGWAFQGYANGLSKFGNGSATAYIDSAVDVTGFSHNAILSLGQGSVTNVTEDVNPDASNMLVATGTIIVSDPNAGQSLLLSSVTALGTTHGSLMLDSGPAPGLSNGGYTYKVSNDAAQALTANASWTDTFIVTSIDGSTMTLAFNTQGANEKPSISEGNFSVQFTEDAAALNSDGSASSGTYQVGGLFFVSDADDSMSTLTISMVAKDGAPGILAAGINPVPFPSIKNGMWTVSISDSDLDSLKSDQSITYHYLLSVSDPHNSVTTQDISITILGADDPIVGDDLSNTLIGTTGNDLMSGLGGIDTIDGLAGDDTIYGGIGDDFLYGGDGNDTIYCGDGNDNIKGGSGINTLNGDAGNDTFFIVKSGGEIHGGAGNDYFYFDPTWGSGDRPSLDVSGDAGADIYNIFIDYVETNPFGINIKDFKPLEDRIAFLTPNLNSSGFSAREDSPDTVTITYQTIAGTVDICSLTFVDMSIGVVGSDWLSNMVNLHVISFS